MKRREFVTTVGTVGALGMPLTLQAQASNAITFLTPSTLSLAFAPELYADVAGKYQDNGVLVRIEIGRAAAQAIQLVAANQVQIGRTGGGSYMAARALGNSDVIAFGTIAQSSPFTLVSSAKAPLAKAADLAGKTIGLPSFGGTAESSLNLLLSGAKINPASIQREKVAYSPATFGLIEAGRLHGFFANTSTVARMMADKMPVHYLDINDGVPGNVYVAREENLQKNPAPYIAFTKSVMQAARELLAMDDKALATAMQRIQKKYDVPGLDRMDVALLDIKATRVLWSENGLDKLVRNDESQWARAQQILESNALMKESKRPMYTNDIWTKAAK
jgi:NitT/TauT family transport system substrate-binding protein